MRQPTRFGKYLLLERIAVGGMAEVFVAKAFGVEGFERLLAIKKILPTMGEDAEFISMFVDEARIAVQLSHANIVQVLELGKHDGTLYIAMEYISGRDVRQLTERFRKRRQQMPIPQACLIVAEVCEALDYAHRKRDASGRPLGIVHRDVSPQNVLVSFDGEVKLIDFGIAKAESRLQKTQAGILKGKFSYMSPEQVKGQEIDGRSDVFACGILLWELICGEKLFTGDSDFAILEKVRNGAVPAPRTLRRDCSEELERVILKALAADPAQRYQTASALHDDLMRFTLQGGMVFGSRQLADWLRQEFKQDWEKEQARLREWLSVEQEVTPADPVRRKDLPKMIGGDQGITPLEPVPVALLNAMAEGASHKTEQFHLERDKDTLVSPPTPPEGLTPLPRPQPAVDPHELPTMKMDDAALAAAEKKQVRKPEAKARPGRAQQPAAKPLWRWLLWAGIPLVLVVLGTVFALGSREPEAKPGRIAVTSTPSVGAELLVDGRSAGQLPTIRSLPAGVHRIEVRADGYRPFTSEVTVSPGGAPIQIEAQLVAEGPMQVEGVVLTQPPARPEPPAAEAKKAATQKKAASDLLRPLPENLDPIPELQDAPSGR